MAQRRFYPKTKTGCLECRKRRVKCDETHPTCAACIRRQTICNYVASPGSKAALSALNANIAATSFNHSHGDVKFDMLDMRLLHHFCTVTSLSIFPDARFQDLWQTVLPAEAEDHTFLMHGILAISALHISLSSGSDRKKYLERGTFHEQLGISNFRKSLADAEQSCPPQVLTTFALVLIILAFIHPQADETLPLLPHFLNLVHLFRGAKALSLLDGSAKQSGRLWKERAEDVSTQYFAKRDQVIRTLSRTHEHIQPGSLPDSEHCLLVAGCRRYASELFDVRVVGFWPALLSDAFYSRVSAHDPAALAVLADYSHVLAGEQGCWWLQSWDTRLVSAIDEVLEHEGKLAINWNLEQRLQMNAAIRQAGMG